MKKLILIILFFVFTGWLSPPASAMTVSDPAGTKIEDWYKDSFSVTIRHGNSKCMGTGTMHTYTYTVKYAGTYTYGFYRDAADDPYIKSSNGDFIALHRKCSQSPSNPELVKSFVAKVDAGKPSVALTAPSTSTTASTYELKGSVSDPEGNMRTLRVIVNGTPGILGQITSNTAFTQSVPLRMGTNTIHMVATDVVGHEATSNTVTITRTASGSNIAGGGTASTPSPPSTNPTPAAPTTSRNNTSAAESSEIKFNQQKIISLDDSYASSDSSDPAAVQEAAALSGATGWMHTVLIAILVLLLLLCVYVIIRFRPVFSELNRDNPGLRRRIVLIVTLPSLLPLLGLGYLGYLQLSESVKNQLSGQLHKAAQTSAIKLDREFTIRRTVISKTGGDILQIKKQYSDMQANLDKQKSACQNLVNTYLPQNQASKVTTSQDCLPFLAGFAQLASSSSASVSAYTNALNKGALLESGDLTAQEDQRVNELLAAVRKFFPDIIELAVVDNSREPVVKSALLPINAQQSTMVQTNKELVARASSEALGRVETKGQTQRLLLTYPIKTGETTIGGVVVAIDTQHPLFIPAIWQSTPKPNAADQVFIVTKEGQLIAPITENEQSQKEVRPLANAQSSTVSTLTIKNHDHAARTATVTGTEWTVAVAAPSSSVLAPLAGIQRTAILAIIGFVLLSVLLCIWFVAGIGGEIRQLLHGARLFAKGNLDHRIQLKSNDELQILGDTMNQMATDIKNAQSVLMEKDKEFIHVATHELKAPMTAIIGFLSMLSEDRTIQLDEKARLYTDQAYASTLRLRDLVADMLDIARLESGHAEFELQPIDIGSLAQTVIDGQQVPAQAATVSLIQATDKQLPKVIADNNKLQIILTNFVSNAIKYNRPGGSVTIAHDIRDGQLVTGVTDTGLGIPVDQQTHIFEKFYRVKHDDRASVPGTGLGMYITKQFIENMGGNVWFTSEHGKGTSFYFSLPMEQQATEQTDLPQGTGNHQLNTTDTNQVTA